MVNDKEILEAQKTLLNERLGRLMAEFELAKRDLSSVQSELDRIMSEENKLREEKENGKNRDL